MARDMGRLATAMSAEEVRIVGGEPLLNPRIVAILQAARASGIARRVVLATNGLLLHTMSNEFWANVDEVRLNLYPAARPTERLVDQARKHAIKSGTHLVVSEYSSFRVTGAKDLRKQLWEFLANNRPLDACQRCLGYVGYKQATIN